jgi:lysyl-tRNA synthetase class 1
VDVRARIEAEKGSPLTEREREILAERTTSALTWLKTYAPDRAKVAVQRDALPREVVALGEDQRLYLGALALRAERDRPASGEDWQALIFSLATEAAIPQGRAFAAIYLAFLGRPNGPRAGWLLASLETDFVLRRLRDAAGWRQAA